MEYMDKDLMQHEKEKEKNFRRIVINQIINIDQALEYYKKTDLLCYDLVIIKIVQAEEYLDKFLC